MSDFDAVLERLLSDSEFQTAVARDPAVALSGYDLSADELDLLHAQFSMDSGGDHSVETRTSKSSVAGLFGPVLSGFSAPSSSALGAAPAQEAFGGAPTPGVQQFGAAGAAESFGAAPGAHSTGGSMLSEGFGAAPGGEHVVRHDTFGSAQPEATGYDPHIDVDGDGQWDSYTAYQRSDGGVDIVADINDDGKVDFVGHDFDHDGRVDSAEYDNDLDGRLDTRMVDDDGDGWLDRSEQLPG